MSPYIVYLKVAGIYKLTCLVNNKIYIGKSINLYSRLGNHKRGEKKVKGRCYFEDALIKHGWNSFTVEILETFENFDKTRDHQMLLDVETRYIELFDSTNKDIGYNLCKYSSDRTGRSHSAETRARIGRSNLGKITSEETKEKLRLANLGKTHSKETKEKMRISRLGASMSDETKEKMRQIRTGQKHSENSKEHMRNIKLGKIFSDEVKKKWGKRKLSPTE